LTPLGFDTDDTLCWKQRPNQGLPALYHAF
jgi:hypothetical protein